MAARKKKSLATPRKTRLERLFDEWGHLDSRLTHARSTPRFEKDILEHITTRKARVGSLISRIRARQDKRKAL